MEPRSCGSALYQRRRQSQRCQLFDRGMRRRRRRLENTSQRAYPIKGMPRLFPPFCIFLGWIYSTLPSAFSFIFFSPFSLLFFLVFFLPFFSFSLSLWKSENHSGLNLATEEDRDPCTFLWNYDRRCLVTVLHRWCDRVGRRNAG